MTILIVVKDPKDWPLKMPGVEVVSSRNYLTDPAYANARDAKVFNLCRSYRYQTLGYYVSLLAGARGQKPMPGISTIQDMKLASVIRLASEEIEDCIQKSLATIQSNKFTLSIYFGKNLAKRHEHLSQRLFRLFPAPLLRAEFTKSRRWHLQNISPISANMIPEEHFSFVVESAREYFSRRRPVHTHQRETHYDLAVLHDPDEPNSPSNEQALKRFTKAAERLGFWVETIGKEDYGRVGEFDGLFIRDNTAVNHYTFRFAQRAAAEGLVVVDDPVSILRCTNKVYLAETLARHRIPRPATLIVHKDNVESFIDEIGYPCILKQPDSAYSLGVFKVDHPDQMQDTVKRLLEKSDLIIAQAFTPTDFDWRVGILGGEVIYVCRYFMAGKHWQIACHDGKGQTRWGDADSIAVEKAPSQLIKVALRAARLMGQGLYGVDLKQVGNRFLVIEVNDNPSIDHGVEDEILGDDLYTRMMQWFLRSIETKKRRKDIR